MIILEGLYKYLYHKKSEKSCILAVFHIGALGPFGGSIAPNFFFWKSL